MKKLIIVKTKDGKEYDFETFLHKASTPEEQQIEAEFYEKYSPQKSVPEGIHYEIEVLLLPASLTFIQFARLHVYKSKKNGKEFLCVTIPIPTLEKALEVLTCWCAGTVYTIETGKDFGLLFKEHGIPNDNFAKLQSALIEHHDITFVG